MSSTASTTEPGPPRAGASTAEWVLAETRRSVAPELRAAVAVLPRPIRQICDYHFGWADPPVAETTTTVGDAAAGWGKAIRAALVLTGAQAIGGDAGAIAVAMPGAVAVELVHNFSLLHDDVMDADATRRGRAAAWTVYGSRAATLAGDALLARAFDVLATGCSRAVRAARLLAETVVRLVAGQQADLDFERRDDVDLDECVAMATGKTAALLGGACALGALFADGTDDQVEELRGFGEALGLAFQHVDDLLGIWGDPSVTGKPIHSDLRNAKKSLPVVAALTSHTESGRELCHRYRSDRLASDVELARAARLVEAAGGRAYSQHQVDRLLTVADGHLHRARPRPAGAARLRALARLATHRDH